MTTRLLFAAIVCLTSVTTIATSTETEIAEIGGMRVDFHLVTKQQRNAVTPSLIKQIEKIKAANLPEHAIEFVRSVPIVVDPSMLTMVTNGQYMSHDNPPYVRIKPIELPNDRPIVL